MTSQSAYGGPDTASPGHASLFTSTGLAYPKTHPAATCKRPCKCWQHANTIIPDPYNPQDRDRYSYVRNNPLRYIDPSGHSVDCGMSDAYCQAGKYTPGGLIALYRHNYGTDIDRRDSPVRAKLSIEIEDYMRGNPEYYPQKDAYLNANRDYKSFNIFLQIRENYWMHRLVQDTGIWDPGEYGRLMAYYDFHADVTLTKWDPSKVDWIDTGLDTLGLGLSFVSLGAAPKSLKAVYANYGNIAAGMWSGFRSYQKDDMTGVKLTAVGFAPPPIGPIASGISVGRDLAQGMYTIPYVPSIPR